jgi:iron complex outermembrane receptor protein
MRLASNRILQAGFVWNAALFYQDYDAPQARIFVNFPLPDGSSITSNSLSNLDAATVYGLDADMRWQATEALSLQGGLTLLDTEIEQTTDTGGNAAKFDGNPLPFAPDVSTTLGGRYAFDVNPQCGRPCLAARKIPQPLLSGPGRAGVAHAERVHDAPGRSGSSDFADPGIDVTLWARNLTDEDYALSGYGFIGYDTFRSDPRTYGLRIGYSF